jgi:FkbM family methyltransferase
MNKEKIKNYIPEGLRPAIKNLINKASAISIKILPRTKHIDYAGKNLYYRSGMSIMDRVVKDKDFEPELYNSIISNISKIKNPVFLDIGANIGLISLKVLEKVPSVKIFCFEPGNIQSNLLSRTIEENSIRNISLEKYALSDTDGEADFYVHSGKDSAKDGLVDTMRGEKTEKTKVLTRKLDSWWSSNGRPKVNVIKIDTEGAEYKVLSGAKELLDKESPVIYFELYKKNIDAFNIKPEDLINLLSSLNYKVSTLSGELVDTNNVPDIMGSNDLFIATKNSSQTV